MAGPRPSDLILEYPGQFFSVAGISLVFQKERIPLASINIGAADNVKKGMRFHVTRGRDFICDIVISDVDMDKASGSFELVKDQPRAGDIVKTNFK